MTQEICAFFKTEKPQDNSKFRAGAWPCGRVLFKSPHATFMSFNYEFNFNYSTGPVMQNMHVPIQMPIDWQLGRGGKGNESISSFPIATVTVDLILP